MTMLGLALALLPFFAFAGVRGACSDGYVQMNSSSQCYSIKTQDSFMGHLTWPEAYDRCENESAILASIKSRTVQTYLNSFLILSRASAGVWIGLNDQDGDSMMTWADMSPFDLAGWDNWAPGQPSHTSGFCVQMVPDDYAPGRWRTVPCNSNSTYTYLCEQDPVVGATEIPPPSCPAQGDPDYFPYFGYCYKIITAEPNFFTYEEAKDKCLETGTDAFLASVRSGYHLNAVLALMLGEMQMASWIGLESFNGVYRWHDVNPIVYTNWGELEPKLNMSITTDGCVYMDNNGDWLSRDCNQAEVTSAICAITLDDGSQPVNPEYGECPEDWQKEGYECFRYVNQNLTWDAAQSQCAELYPDAHISVPHNRAMIDWEQYGISFGDNWIGVTKNAEERFETADGSALNYVNWAQGQPEDMAAGEICLVTSITTQGESFWSGQTCDNQHPFFCAFPQITGPRETGECRSGWFKYRNKCYQHFNERLPFSEARRQCQSKAIGGDLASVYTAELQALLTYLMRPWTGGSPTGDVWIGLADTSNQGDFKWTNGLDFGDYTYNNWAPGQPDGYLDFFDETEDKSDCAKMMADPMTPGLWDDVSCKSTELTYLCESYLDPLQPTPEPPPTALCPAGYVAAEESCYRIVEDDLTFGEALAECEKDGASLASVVDGYEQGLLQFLLTVSSSVKDAWIGINDEDNDGEYKWADNATVAYTNWNADEPSGGQCVILRSTGFWLEEPCSQTRPSVCEISPNVPVVTPEPMGWHCDEGWELHEASQRCFLIDTYRLPASDLASDNAHVTYAQAEQSCAAMGAGMPSLHGPDETLWFYGMVRFTLGRRSVWLGMQRSMEGRLQWDDGSVMNYVNWADNEPSGQYQGTDCVTLYAGDKGLAQWSDTSCFATNAFTCQKAAKPGNAPLCEPGWDADHLKSSDCYYLQRPEEGLLSWEEAEEACNEMGGHLASILNYEDSFFISYLLEARLTGNPESWPWIGLRRTPGTEKFTWGTKAKCFTPDLDAVILWIDGHTSRYTSWGSNQPDGMDDDCSAIRLEGTYMDWNNINCGLRRPFLCKKRTDASGAVTPGPSTPVPAGGCSGHGQRLGNRCYELMTEPLTWEAARAACSHYPNGDLASVPNYAVQALTASLFRLVSVDNIWIGMTSKMPGTNFVRQYYWIDGSTIEFTNWGSGQPSMADNEDGCVKMLTDPDTPGKWYDDKCELQYAYMCQHDIEPGMTPEPVGTFAPCPSGFEGAGSSCFRVETVERAFSNAVDSCKKDGGILAPVMDGFENAFVELLMFNAGIDSAWIGLQSSKATSEKYEWSSSQWPETYMNWAENEPSTKTGCVTTEYSKGWQPIDCAEARPSICRSANDVPPSEAPFDPNLRCPDRWYQYNQQCYLINTGFESDSLLNAFFKCASIGGVPTSVHSRSENLFIRNSAINELTGRYVWLGLVHDQGRYRWMDGSPVDYTNWEEGQEFNSNDGKDCVWMVPEREGRWQRQDCTQQAEVVCMQFEQKLLTTKQILSTRPVDVTPVPVTGLNTGQLVAIGVGSCLAAFIVLLCLCYFCESPSGKQEQMSMHLTQAGGAGAGGRGDDVEREMAVAEARRASSVSASSSESSGGKVNPTFSESL